MVCVCRVVWGVVWEKKRGDLVLLGVFVFGVFSYGEIELILFMSGKEKAEKGGGVGDVLRV